MGPVCLMDGTAPGFGSIAHSTNFWASGRPLKKLVEKGYSLPTSSTSGSIVEKRHTWASEVSLSNEVSNSWHVYTPSWRRDAPKGERRRAQRSYLVSGGILHIEFQRTRGTHPGKLNFEVGNNVAISHLCCSSLWVIFLLNKLEKLPAVGSDPEYKFINLTRRCVCLKVNMIYYISQHEWFDMQFNRCL